MDSKIVKENKYRPYLAAFCAIGWSLAYPLIKYGYGEFNIADDLGSKLLFGGIRFAAAGLLVLAFGIITKTNLKIKDAKNWGLIWLFALVNTSLHYMFAYIGLSNLPSSRSTILDSMGGFFLIILSGIIYKEDRINAKKLLGCLFGFFGIVLINIAPASELFAQISFKGDGYSYKRLLCRPRRYSHKSCFKANKYDCRNGLRYVFRRTYYGCLRFCFRNKNKLEYNG